MIYESCYFSVVNECNEYEEIRDVHQHPHVTTVGSKKPSSSSTSYEGLILFTSVNQLGRLSPLNINNLFFPEIMHLVPK